VITAEAYLTNPKYLITNTGEVEFLGTDVELVSELVDLDSLKVRKPSPSETIQETSDISRDGPA
jgi:hypothetical protein